jgi:glycine hydroxymethyltransferase
VIAAKAVAFKIAGTEEFKERQERVLEGAKIIAERLNQADVADAGVSVLTGGTDVHLVLVDLRNSQLVTSGLRIGTPALATRGFGAAEFTEVADIIATALKSGSATDVEALQARVDKLAADFPLYPQHEQW